MRPPWSASTFDVVLGRHILWALPDPAVALRRWAELLVPTGRLVLIEGRWHTGAGLTGAQALELIATLGRTATVTKLSEPFYWGGPIDDERYLITSPARSVISTGFR